MATDPNIAYHLRDDRNGIKVRTLDITDYQLTNWSAIYHCVSSVERTMTTSGLIQFRRTTKSLSKQSSFSNPDVSNKDSLELRSGQINPFMTCTSRGVLIRYLVICFRRRILNKECECFLFAIDNRVHAHPGFDVSLIVKLLRNWDRENGLSSR